MCGLVGMVGNINADSKRAFTALLTLAQCRGTDASGVAAFYNKPDKHTWKLVKTNIPASELIELKSYNELLSTRNLYYLMGHTRLSTQGNAASNGNNHPIVAGSVVGTHNGMIYNSDQLFRTSDLPQEYAVDSEILFRIADKAMTHTGLEVKPFSEMLKLCNGSIAMAFSSIRHPNIHILSDSVSSLYQGSNREQGLFIYGSILTHLKGITQMLPKGKWSLWEAPTDTLVSLNPKTLEWTQSKLDLPRSQYSSTRWAGHYYDDYADEDYESYSYTKGRATEKTVYYTITTSTPKPGKELPYRAGATVMYYAFAKLNDAVAKIYKSGQTAPKPSRGGVCIACAETVASVKHQCAMKGYWKTTEVFLAGSGATLIKGATSCFDGFSI